jgi:ADP-L-glycero-D-manno-heptose 6-epimerase
LSDLYIVTGAAGLIGSNIAKELNSRGITNILAVDNLNHPLKQANLDSIEYAEFMPKQDFRKRFLSGAQPAAKTVFHLGACSSTTETDNDYLRDNNFLYTRQLCEWCLENDTRFIYASSAATYGDGTLGYSDDHAGIEKLQPLNLYGQSKQLFDMWALQNDKLNSIAGIKYFNVFGPGEDHKGDMRSLVNKAVKQINETGQLKLFKSHRPDYGDGEQVRDFIYVKDAAAVTLFFHDNPSVSGIFNCGTGQARSWLDLGRAVFSAMGKEPDISFVDMPESIRDKYQYHTQADMKKLKAAGYSQDYWSLESAVSDYVQNYLEKK